MVGLPTNFDFEKNLLNSFLCFSADDSWLNVSPEQLDDLLSTTYKSAFQEDVSTTDLGHVAKSMKAFVKKVSSHEGAEFPMSVLRNSYYIQLDFLQYYCMSTAKRIKFYCIFLRAAADDEDDDIPF